MLDSERLDGIPIDLADPADLAVDEQDRLLLQMLGCVDVSVLDEGEHVGADAQSACLDGG